jgi:uncharacterized protein
MIFVDTGVWFALAVPTDPDYGRLRKWLESNKQPLVTTDYIVDETLTLLRARGENSRALVIGEQLLNGTVASVHKVDLPDILAAWEIFKRFADKEWSFTDCVSYVMIQRLHVSIAVSLDQHFRQFGMVTVLP